MSSDSTLTPSDAPRDSLPLSPEFPLRRWRSSLLLCGLALVVAAIFVGLLGVSIFIYRRLDASLPRLEGEFRMAALEATVTIERDALGVPTIRAESRRDVARATGFLHAQERFFQMDLTRRRASGELAELVGAFALRMDRRIRPHRLQVTARAAYLALEPEARDLLDAYTAGVESGLSALGAPPFEYLVLRQEPVAWSPEDSLLVMLAMFAQLQDPEGRLELARGRLRDDLPRELFHFLTPQGTEWDAPLLGAPLPTPTPPGPEVVDLRRDAPTHHPRVADHAGFPRARARLTRAREWEPSLAGSNAWALDDTRTQGTGALLANDMHLSLSLPNIWYRASFLWPDPTSDQERRVTGATLPGTPMMVIGSNGRIAWGFTNSNIDSSDVVILETDPADENRYRSPEGWREFESHREELRVRGADPETLEVRWSSWGPVLGRNHRGRPYAVRWTAHTPEALDLRFLAMETAEELDTALLVAQRSGIPNLGIVLADATGRIGWTLTGRIPRREGFDGRWPQSWADGEQGWRGWLFPEEIPSVADPEDGRLWAANNRMVGGEMLARVGDGGYVFGARAYQIRGQLMTIGKATLDDMMRIQLDDRAVFLSRWRDLLLEVLSPEALEGQPARRELRQLAHAWDGRAAVDSAGYPLVTSFRRAAFHRAFAPLVEAARGDLSEDAALYTPSLVGRQAEGPLWRLLTERPLHLLDPAYENWEALLLAAADDVLADADKDGRPLAEQTWGSVNVVRLRHPLSYGIPGVGRWLDMPPTALPGGYSMPRYQTRFEGASQRMAVFPGREAEGYFHMPGGQSGHPLSPFYQAGHDAWVHGKPLPFLPGPPAHTLRLVPGRNGSAAGSERPNS